MSDEAFTLEDTVIEAEEDFVIDAQFLIQELMNEHGLSRADLAKKLGVSKARLTQMMKPDANPTMRSVARVAHALGEKVRLRRDVPIATSKPDLVGLIWNEISAHDDGVLGDLDRAASTKVLRSLKVHRERAVHCRAHAEANDFSSNDNFWSSPTLEVAV